MSPEEVLETIDDVFVHKMEDEVDFDIELSSEFRNLHVDLFGVESDDWSSLGGILVQIYLRRKYPNPEVRKLNHHGWGYYKVKIWFDDTERGELKSSHEKNDIYEAKYRTKREKMVVNNLKNIIQILDKQDITYLSTSSSISSVNEYDTYKKLFLVIFCHRDLESTSIKRFHEFNR
jgi:hypothetical protein